MAILYSLLMTTEDAVATAAAAATFAVTTPTHIHMRGFQCDTLYLKAFKIDNAAVRAFAYTLGLQSSPHSIEAWSKFYYNVICHVIVLFLLTAVAGSIFFFCIFFKYYCIFATISIVCKKLLYILRRVQSKSDRQRREEERYERAKKSSTNSKSCIMCTVRRTERDITTIHTYRRIG